MLLDRKIDFSETKEDEWVLLRSKISGGIELSLPESERWFLATLDGENIRIEGAKKNVRPVSVPTPIIITFKEFARVAEHYNSFFTHDVNTMQAKLEVQRTMPNLRYIFNLIYNLL